MSYYPVHFLQQSFNGHWTMLHQNCLQRVSAKNPSRILLTFNYATFILALFSQLSVTLAHVNILCVYVFTLTSHSLPCSLPLISTSCMYNADNSSLLGLLGPMKTDALSSLKMPVTIFQLAWRHNKEDLNLNKCHWKNLKYCQLNRLGLYHQASIIMYQCYNMLP